MQSETPDRLGVNERRLPDEQILSRARLRAARTGARDRLPHPAGRARRVDVPDAEHRQRIDDGVDAGRQRADRVPASPAPFMPSGLIGVGTGFSSIATSQKSSARGMA